MLNTSEILSHLGKKDKRAFLESIYSFKSECIVYLYRKVGCNNEQAEDIFIDAIMILWEKAQKEGLEEVKDVKGYLFGTCYMMWMNTYKKEKKKRDSIPDVERYFYEYRNVLGADQESPALLKEKLLDVSQQALLKLGEKCLRIIKYFYFEHKNMEEIAGIMGFSSAAVVSSLKYRCFKELKEKANELAGKSNLKH